MPLHVLFADSGALRSRCETTTLTPATADPAYETDAIIPAGSWVSLTEEQARDLIPEPATPDSVLVELVALRTPLTNPLDTFAEELGGPSACYLGQASSPPDALTTTANYADGRRIGLHLDSWDKLRYAAKGTGRRRLCLNLGPGTRYLLLCGADAQEICRAVHPDDFVFRYPGSDDVRQYIADGHLATCYRFRIEPGEGYLAPTEFIPHDGSTQQQQQSAAAFWLGHWPRKALPSLA
ncbi:hypothetical protein [Streptomyces sp. NPDC058989]|uniref:hypothetical protein n=1 Tax=Streptomyces sp. NPDC058989 TaxID=3346686 RepID=UPI0036B7C663